MTSAEFDLSVLRELAEEGNEDAAAKLTESPLSKAT